MGILNNWQEARDYLTRRRYKKSNSRPIGSYAHLVAYNEEELNTVINKLYDDFAYRRSYHVAEQAWICPCGQSIRGNNWHTVSVAHNPRIGWSTHPEYTDHHDSWNEWFNEVYAMQSYLTRDEFRNKLLKVFKPSNIATNTFGSIFIVRYKTKWRPSGYMLGSLNPDGTKTMIRPFMVAGPSDRYYYNMLMSTSIPTDSVWDKSFGINIKRYQYKMYLRTKHMGTIVTNRGRCKDCVKGLVPRMCNDHYHKDVDTNYILNEIQYCKHGRKDSHYAWGEMITCFSCQGTGKKSHLAMAEWFGLPVTFDSDMKLVDSFDIDNLSTLRNFTQSSIPYAV